MERRDEVPQNFVVVSASTAVAIGGIRITEDPTVTSEPSIEDVA